MSDTTFETPGGGRVDGAISMALDSAGKAVPSTGTTDSGIASTTRRGLTNGAPFESADQSASAAAVTAAPTSGQKLVIDDLLVSADTDMTVTFTEETTGYVVIKAYLAANVPWQLTTRAKLKLETADKKLMLQTSVAGNVSVQAFSHSEA
jgi:hypothetical protein